MALQPSLRPWRPGSVHIQFEEIRPQEKMPLSLWRISEQIQQQNLGFIDFVFPDFYRRIMNKFVSIQPNRPTSEANQLHLFFGIGRTKGTPAIHKTRIEIHTTLTLYSTPASKSKKLFDTQITHDQLIPPPSHNTGKQVTLPLCTPTPSRQQNCF